MPPAAPPAAPPPALHGPARPAAPVDRRAFLSRAVRAGAALSAAPWSLPSAAALVAGGPRIPAGPPAARRTPGRQRVVVLGAGLAGLAAALELREAGHEVVVLEARLRPGGRVHTLRAPFADGLHAEAGAARIPSTHALVQQYAARFGLELVPFAPGDRPAAATATAGAADVAYVGGRRWRRRAGAPLDLATAPLPLRDDEQRLGVDGLAERYLGPLLARVGDASAAGWPPPALADADRVSVVEWLRRAGASPGAVRALLLGLYAPEDPAWPSALWVAREFALGFGSRGLRTVRGGMDRLPHAMAAPLADAIHYGARVVRIAQDARGVRVAVRNARGGALEQVEGDLAVCTLPFGALRDVATAPAFSPGKQRAVRELGYGAVTRVYLQLRRRVWADGGCTGFALTDWPEEVWSPTWDQPGPRGLLVSYLRGARAEADAALDEGARVATVLDRLERVFPGVRAECEGGTSTVWHADPYARGAYAAMTPGQLTALGPHLATPEGRVHFAGEHTSPWQAWMEGALWSGRAAARAIGAAV